MVFQNREPNKENHSAHVRLAVVVRVAFENHENGSSQLAATRNPNLKVGENESVDLHAAIELLSRKPQLGRGQIAEL